MIRGLASILLVATALTGCGGGTNSAGSTPPTPAPPPVATEVSRQTPVNPTFTALTQAETFNTVASTARLNVDGNGLASNVTSTQGGFSTAVTIAYNPANQGYTVSTNRGGIANQTSFAATDIVGSSGGVVQYDKVGATNESTLLLTTAGLQYSALGTWTDLSISGSGNLVQASLFAFGQETAIAALPKTGSASYAFAVAGIGREGTTPFGLGGAGSANVNFTASSLTTVFDLGVFDSNGAQLSTQTINGTATIASGFARFSGTLSGTFSGTSVSGPLSGAFFGPAGEEIGGSWRFTGGQVEAVGAFVGTLND